MTLLGFQIHGFDLNKLLWFTIKIKISTLRGIDKVIQLFLRDRVAASLRGLGLVQMASV